MSKTARTAVSVVAVCAAFLVGATTRRIKRREIGPSRQSLGIKPKRSESDRVRVALGNVRNLRRDLAEKERKIAQLERDLAEVRAKLPPPLSHEEEKRKREEEETRRRAERRRAAFEKSDRLREKILQRWDKALRQEGLAELAAFVESGDPEELLVGLTTLARLHGLNFEKERFKPQILTALSHEDPEIRRAALECLQTVCTPREIANIVLSMAGDPSPEIRLMVVDRLRWFNTRYRSEEVTSVLRVLGRDDDKNVRRGALAILYSSPEYAEEMEDLEIEMSRDSENPKAWIISHTDTHAISPKVVRRLVEMFEEGHAWDEGVVWLPKLSDDTKPIVIDFFLHVVRDSIDNRRRLRALSDLGSVADALVIPELQEIAASDDAESIEGSLARAIEHLQRKAEEQQ